MSIVLILCYTILYYTYKGTLGTGTAEHRGVIRLVTF